jgi:hypothetical protein
MNSHLKQISLISPIEVSAEPSCTSCLPLTVRGSQKYLSFELSFNKEDGCQRLTVVCGKEKGTEAIVQVDQS